MSNYDNLKKRNILIVGLGMIGGSYAMGLNEKGIIPYGFDINEVTMDYAISNNIIRDETDVQKILPEVDLVVLCLYPNLNIEWIRNNQKYLKSGTIITDVTGIKKYLIEEVSTFIRSDIEFVPSHPMAGREISGIKGSNPEVFKSANFIIVPMQSNKEESVCLIKELAIALEFKNIEVLSVEKHDDVVSFLSQLTHVIAISLMNSRDVEHMIRFTGDSFRDLTRISKINEKLWSELFLLNKEQLVKDINNFKNELDSFKILLENEDVEGIKNKMIKSTERRKLFDKK